MKHPVPKQKKSKISTRQQYGAFSRGVKTRLTNLVRLTTCTQCGEKKMQHHICPNCGTYKGREMLKVGKTAKQIKTVQA